MRSRVRIPNPVSRTGVVHSVCLMRSNRSKRLALHTSERYQISSFKDNSNNFKTLQSKHYMKLQQPWAGALGHREGTAPRLAINEELLRPNRETTEERCALLRNVKFQQCMAEIRKLIPTSSVVQWSGLRLPTMRSRVRIPNLVSRTGVV